MPKKLGPDSVRKRIGNAARQARLEKRVSQEELAAKVGMTQPEISRLEKGENEQAVFRLIEIERALGVPLGHILIRAGFVEGLDSVEQAVAAASDLIEDDRRTLIRLYRALRGDRE